MKIKTTIKLSFLTVIVLVFIIATVSFVVTSRIRENSLLSNKISQLVLLQERMNQAVQDLTESTSIDNISHLKSQFNQYEIAFEKIKKTIPFARFSSDLNLFAYDKSVQAGIITNLQALFINEHKVELSFVQIYALQEKQIAALQRFEQLYPQEKQQRSELYQKVLALQDFNSIHHFGLVQYYSKEALYQHQTPSILAKWISAITDTQDALFLVTLKNQLEQYRVTATNIGNSAISIKQIEQEKNQLITSITSVLQNNKLLAIAISQAIEKNSIDTTYRLILMLISLTACIILFIIFFSIKVSANVGLSVDEIEQKVQQGLKQITALNEEIESTQKEVVFTMGTIAEHRSKETGNHVKRVAHYSKILALHSGLSEQESEMLKQASPMHDIGKLAIPDAILNKPGRFNEQERKIMDNHAFLGYEMLSNSDRPLLKAAAIVAHEHHEKWDGTGYPNQLCGENIHIYGRITALADVFDALGSERVYKKAWQNEKIFQLFKEQRGKHFDPQLVDIFFANLDQFLQIQSSFRDV